MFIFNSYSMWFWPAPCGRGSIRLRLLAMGMNWERLFLTRSPGSYLTKCFAGVRRRGRFE